MATQFVGAKEFRQNFSAYGIKLQKKKGRLIVLKKNRPFLEVRGLDERAASLEQLARDVAEAREDVKQGRVLTQTQIMKEFGLL